MHLSLLRTSFGAIAGSTFLSLALATAAAAQVATLAEPDPNADETSAPVAEDLEGEEAVLAWARCMRDNGIEMDDPRFGADGGRLGFGAGGAEGQPFDLQSPEFQGAMEACGNVLSALAPELDAAEQAERAEQQLAIAACMRERSYDFPDPATGGGFGAQLRFLQEAGIDPQDPAFQADITACQSAAGFEFTPPGGGGAAG